jgi:hypothetical protein
LTINYDLTFRTCIILKEQQKLKRSLLCFFVTDIFEERHGITCLSFRASWISFKKFQRDDTLYSTLLFPVGRSTCFGHIPCPSSGAQLTVLTAVLTHPRRRLDTHCSSTPDAVSTINWAPDDGHGICPKHVERPTGNNKVLYKVSSRNFLKHGITFYKITTEIHLH